MKQKILSQCESFSPKKLEHNESAYEIKFFLFSVYLQIDIIQMLWSNIIKSFLWILYIFLFINVSQFCFTKMVWRYNLSSTVPVVLVHILLCCLLRSHTYDWYTWKSCYTIFQANTHITMFFLFFFNIACDKLRGSFFPLSHIFPQQTHFVTNLLVFLSVSLTYFSSTQKKSLNYYSK